VLTISELNFRNYSQATSPNTMSRLSVGPLSDSARFLSQHPFSGTPYHWTFSDRPLYQFSISGSTHFFSGNLSPVFYCNICAFTVYSLVDSVIVLLFEPR